LVTAPRAQNQREFGMSAPSLCFWRRPEEHDLGLEGPHGQVVYRVLNIAVTNYFQRMIAPWSDKASRNRQHRQSPRGVRQRTRPPQPIPTQPASVVRGESRVEFLRGRNLGSCGDPKWQASQEDRVRTAAAGGCLIAVVPRFRGQPPVIPR